MCIIFKKSNRGFTLIELLVVIAIIALLATLILAALGNARKKARDAVRRSDLAQFRTAMEMYYNEYNSYPLEIIGYDTSAGQGNPPDPSGDNWDENSVMKELELAEVIAKAPVDPLNKWPNAYTYDGGYWNGTEFEHSFGKSYALCTLLEETGECYCVSVYPCYKLEDPEPRSNCWCPGS